MVRFLLILLLLVTGVGPGAADNAVEAWLDEPDFDPALVNEGELSLHPEPPSEPVHAHYNRITLTTDSLRDGWAGLYQCHTHMDAVPDAQVVFRPGRIRGLEVASTVAIGQARVDGHTVQIKGVEHGAELCLRAESRVVTPADDGFFVRNGPFMRSFLDGYYPMHVTLEIVLPPGEWQLFGSRPASQPGFEVQYTAGRVTADAWFSGELRTEFHFLPAK
jgi:hypothetical protein